jgi:hypothetical protein
MSEHDNDKLEQFFKKAASKPDIAFNENDWQKLEARLDAMPPDLSLVKRPGLRIASTVVLSVLFVIGTVYWNAETQSEIQIVKENRDPRADADATVPEDRSDVFSDEHTAQSSQLHNRELKNEIYDSPTINGKTVRKSVDGGDQPDSGKKKIAAVSTKNTFGAEGNLPAPMNNSGNPLLMISRGESKGNQTGVTQRDKSQIYRDLVQGSSATIAAKIKQKAGGQLPGAEEEDSRREDAIVKEEYASGQTKHLVSSRLSLLLSLAPDFSSTSINKYTSPGGAFGAMIHYHIRNSWSVSAGVIKNQKKYTGDGDDYQPPKGYWKYYTNDVVPGSIDGSCSVLEIPVMVQYTVANAGKGRFLIGGGASSYVMLNESYRYYFDQPNPGAKEGWDSKNRSRFLFNMINFTVGYEREVAPGLLLGLEPYLKIPIEEIGWSNLKLFSMGASFTLRYNLLKKRMSLQAPGRSPG